MRSSAVDLQRAFPRAATVLLLGVWAFLTFDCSVITPPNGWSKRWGPLVPHRTFPGDCAICHIPKRWDVLKEAFAFDHEKETGFALEGAHARAACLRCHNDRGPVTFYIARGCGGCHPDPHKGTLGVDCKRCHEQRSWRPAGLVAEHARTRFPLFGAHVVVPCERCHEGAPVGDFRGTPVDCDLCHRADLAKAISPDHQALGWTRNCERCHTPSSWTRSHFAHAFFPLTGGHSGLDCSRCHVGGVFTGLSQDCYICHQANYESAPNHLALGFPHDCTQCHTVGGFNRTPRFHHTRFPLVGSHNTTCDTCHFGGSTSNFNCLVCHFHDQSLMDPAHAAVGGYSYVASACYGCHPNGRRP